MAGFAEELLFRGLIQAALGDWLSPTTGLIVASACGLAHPITVGYATVVTVAGFYSGGLWLWSGNLLVPIVAHAAYDFVALVYLVRRPRNTAVRPIRLTCGRRSRKLGAYPKTDGDCPILQNPAE